MCKIYVRVINYFNSSKKMDNSLRPKVHYKLVQLEKML